MKENDWFSYDRIAATYAASAEPLYFAAPARDLVARLQLAPRERLLDIGSGSGAIARAANIPFVVGTDPAVTMLVTSRIRKAVAGALPRLPFRAHTFDAASLGFVLSHVGDVGAALRDVARILVRGGRIAASSWMRSAGESGPGAIFDTVARRYVDSNALDAAIAAALPAEDRLSRSEALVDALLGAGFLDPHIDERAYAVTVGASEFLESRQVSGTARFLRASLDDATWTRFLEEATAEITRELGDRVEVELAVSFVTACTPC